MNPKSLHTKKGKEKALIENKKTFIRPAWNKTTWKEKAFNVKKELLKRNRNLLFMITRNSQSQLSLGEKERSRK